MTCPITSVHNPQIKATVKLRHRRQRDLLGRFLIEGYRELTRAVAGGVAIEKLFYCPALFLGENEPALIDAIAFRGARKLETSRTVFDKLTYRDRPDGLLAVASKGTPSLEDLATLMADPPLLIVAEGIEKPGNLGSILRSADGVGADGVIVCDRCTDITNPNVVRASVGTLFTQPVVEVKGGDLYTWLKDRQIQIVATSPTAVTTYTEVDLRGPTAVVIGTEQLGLSNLWLNGSDVRASIPMYGSADSLNVATAATLFLYEALRQRTTGGPI